MANGYLAQVLTYAVDMTIYTKRLHAWQTSMWST
jgi:hypothetical protein